MPRCSITIVEPTSLLSDVGDPRDAFQRIWRRLPMRRPRESWVFLEQDGGLFLKVLVKPPGLGRHAYRKARRLRNERSALAHLARRGLPVPPVVAFGEERRAGYTLRSFLITRQIHDSVDLESYLGSGLDADDRPRRRAVLKAAGRVVARLHEARCIHRDLAPRNLLVSRAPARPAAWLIDCPCAEIDPPALVLPIMKRAELYRLTRGMLRAGAVRDDAATLLEETHSPDQEALLEHAAATQTDDERLIRRARLWCLTGGIERRLLKHIQLK